MITKEELGRKIRDLRSRNNKSQGELGNYLSKSHAAISDIERGKTELSVSDLNKISQFFGVPVENLLSETTSPYYAGTISLHRADRGMSDMDKIKMQKAREEFIKKAREINQ
ncbi:MAG: helix-turn-helix transcriptional regulator [Patescibacteria group bacterium]